MTDPRNVAHDKKVQQEKRITAKKSRRMQSTHLSGMKPALKHDEDEQDEQA